MLVATIQAELVRLHVHPVNLSAAQGADGLVALKGSLLRYWKLPSSLDGPWLLSQLQGCRDAAGAEVVMSSLVAAHDKESMTAPAGEGRTQLRLFDPQRPIPATGSAAKTDS
jgi:hypothetical protein